MACKRWGLTGGIGSGKSTVAQMLQTQGAAVVDADQISRGLTASGGLAIDPIRAAFGPQAIDGDGALQRSFMRQLVFSDPTAKQRLEAILHPLVGQQIEHHTQQAQDQGAACIVLDIPLLVESGHWRKKLHGVLVVDCEVSTQITRVMQRSGLEREAVERIIAAQATRAQRCAAADCVIYNNGLDLSGLRQEVLSISPWLQL